MVYVNRYLALSILDLQAFASNDVAVCLFFFFLNNF